MPIQASSPTEATPAYTKLSIAWAFWKDGRCYDGSVGEIYDDNGYQHANSLNGAQVILDQYSTAPHSYNVQLVGDRQ